MTPTDPLAGWTGETAYLRSQDNSFVLLPSGRLQMDGYFYKRDTDKMPTPSILLRRARLELGGWIGDTVFFNLAGDFAAGAPAGADPIAQSWLATTDDYVGVAPWKNLAILQVGQFDAPFTLENRTSDKYFDFMERSITVRAFGAPSNKESGAMVHGILPSKAFYYSAGVFNGDGQNFKNADSNFDFIGRAWVAPFAAAGMKSLEDIEVGGSLWLGKRAEKQGLKVATQSTQGGFTFFDPTWKLAGTSAMGVATTTPAELHQSGNLTAFALELNVPIEHRFGVRVEYVNKSQEVAQLDVTAPAAPVPIVGGSGKLTGSSVYGEVWYWLVGDDTIIGAPGLQLPSRLKKFETKAPRHGVMLAVRVDHLDENITTDTALAKDPTRGSRQVTAAELGVNYWYSKRFRGSFNYVLNHIDGDAGGVTDTLAKLSSGTKDEHEFLFRLGIAL
jgi:phosphate-selective porin